MEATVVRKKKGISPIWILPLLALSIGAWLLYTSYRDAGIDITIHYPYAEGITPGKTQVMYKGVAVGLVKGIRIDDDLQGLSLLVNMKVKQGLVKDTKFWIVKPEISAGRVSGLETILSGSYIAVQPGTSSEQARHFEGLSGPPALPPDTPGLHLTLRADALHSMQKGSPVYTRNLKIGKIKDYKLADDNSILIDIFIEPQFSHLVRVGTRFWNASGLSLDGNLQSGFKLNMESLASLIYGGIACGTPEPLAASSPPAANGMVFKLYNSFDEAEYGLKMTLRLASGKGIIEGRTKVRYRGLEAGVVKKIRINRDENHSVTAEILLDPRAEPILREGTKFWVVRPKISIDGIEHIETIISGPYISFKPGNGPYRDSFVVEQDPMPRLSMRTGKHFTLVAPTSGSLSTGNPVLYKNITIGEISSIDFGPRAETILIDILIYDDYAFLVKKNTIFWNVSGVSIDASLSHFNINMSSIKSVLAGGIAFTSPDRPDSVEAPEGTSFPLYAGRSEAIKANPELRPPGTILKLRSSADNSFDAGSPVLYKNIPVGEVLRYELSKDLQTITFDVLIREEYAQLINASTRFYNFSGFTLDAGLAGIEFKSGPINSIISGGISFFTPGQGKPLRDNDSFILYQDRDSAIDLDSLKITLRLDRADGIGAKTRIRYQGIEIGRVKAVRFTRDLRGVIAEARINGDAARLFRKTTRLWLVKPEISLAGVKNIDTVLTGPYINVVPGDGDPETEFALQSQAPETGSYAGLNIILETPRLGSLTRGSPVYYRQVQVGSVTGFELSPAARQVWVRVNIEPPYEKLVHSGTRFWIASGFRVSWGLFAGLDISTESMASLLAGGIAFATPDGEMMGEAARDNDHFALHEEPEDSWLDWSPAIMLNEEKIKTAEPQGATM